MRVVIAMLAVSCAACGQQSQQPAAEPESSTPVAPTPSPAAPPAPGTQGGLPDDRKPLEEPHGPIDPKSAEAAGQVVQSYGALIEQKRFAEAEKLWGDAARARGVSEELRRYAEVHLQIGKPEEPEGAAGSIYVNVPTVLYGKRNDGSAFNRSGQMTLRRVNDVPGSTEAQRRWHIESAEWLEKD
ncbi:hypothetical protein [Sphingomonas hankyongi]|uniref:Lipoprotein n=1 Tax=Sphingomonas hankyongi TaxID=2908209 RepID=A0ABT0S331_9SPHN|nr:hypothetical protein [Sphingomonas hankyongi]MCL6730033.1 hypothetical protein [Sphingomonas hankyongi]